MAKDCAILAEVAHKADNPWTKAGAYLGLIFVIPVAGYAGYALGGYLGGSALIRPALKDSYSKFARLESSTMSEKMTIVRRALFFPDSPWSAFRVTYSASRIAVFFVAGVPRTSCPTSSRRVRFASCNSRFCSSGLFCAGSYDGRTILRRSNGRGCGAGTSRGRRPGGGWRICG